MILYKAMNILHSTKQGVVVTMQETTTTFTFGGKGIAVLYQSGASTRLHNYKNVYKAIFLEKQRGCPYDGIKLFAYDNSGSTCVLELEYVKLLEPSKATVLDVSGTEKYNEVNQVNSITDKF